MRRVFNGRVQILDSNGDPEVGAKLEFFAAGTANNLDTFSDYALTTANTNPVITDSGGWVTIFLTPNVFYDYTTVDSNDVTIYDKELNIQAYEPPLTTKGDIFTFDTDFQRLPVGTDGLVLKADSSEATGLVWGTAGTGSPLTTKGDLYTYDTDNQRLPVGNDTDILVADSSEATGLKWVEVARVGAYLGSDESLTASSFTKIVFDTEEYDSGGDFATGTFTAPVTAKYLLCWCVYAGPMNDRSPLDSQLYKNGVAFKTGTASNVSNATSDYLTTSGSIVLILTAGDTIDIYARCETSGVNAKGGQKLTYFSATRMA